MEGVVWDPKPDPERGAVGWLSLAVGLDRSKVDAEGGGNDPKPPEVNVVEKEGAVDDPKPPEVEVVEKEGAVDAPNPPKVELEVAGVGCWVVEFPKVDIDPNGGFVVLEPNPLEMTGVPKVEGAVEEPNPPELMALPKVDSVLGRVDVSLPKPPVPVDLPKEDSVAGCAKGDEVVLSPKFGVKGEAVGSSEEPNFDKSAESVAGSSSGTNMLSSSSSAS